MGLIASSVMRGKLNHRTLCYLGFSCLLLLPQHLKCPGFKRPPAEDNEEAGSRAETQGMELLPKLPWCLLAGGIMAITLLLCPPFSSALPWACWAARGWRCWTSLPLAWTPKPSSTCGECRAGRGLLSCLGIGPGEQPHRCWRYQLGGKMHTPCVLSWNSPGVKSMEVRRKKSSK